MKRTANTGASGLAATLLLVFGLSGCETVTDLFSEEKPPPLPGDRIAILLHQRTLSPDPELADVQILLPAPEVNADWPQSGGFPNHAMHHMKIAENLSQAWSVDIGSGTDDEIRLASSPVIAKGCTSFPHRQYAMFWQHLVLSAGAGPGSGWPARRPPWGAAGSCRANWP